MTWSQVYDPIGQHLLSTILAAMPVIVLLGAIGIFEMKAHLAALLGLVSALLIAILVFGMPAGMAVMSAVYGAGFGLWPIGWIILNVIFLYQLTAREGRVRGPAAQHPQHLRRPPAAAAVHRLLLRRLLRGGGRLRHAGRGHRRHADRAGLLAALGRRPVPDRQHRAGGLRRAGHAGDRAGRGDRARPARAQRHDRPPAAVLLADRAVLADLGVRRLPQDAGGLAGGAGRRRLVRRSRSISSRTSTAPGWSTSWPRSSSMVCLALFLRVWHPRRPMTETPRDWSSKDRRRRAARAPGGRHLARGGDQGLDCPGSSCRVFVFVWGTPQFKAFLDGLCIAKLPIAGPEQSGA